VLFPQFILVQNGRILAPHSIQALGKEWGPQPLANEATNSLAQNLQRNQQILNSPDKRPAKTTGIVSLMAKIIPVSFRRSRLPKTLLRDGWWLESTTSGPTIVAFPKRNASSPPSNINSKAKCKASYLTLVHSGK
jgi:hypothetical protein